MKTYVVMISRTFPATHSQSGEPTGFVEKILNEVTTAQLIDFKMAWKHDLDLDFTSSKIHTIRANYDLWRKRIEQVYLGEAELSLRYWSGKPYNSKQVEFLRLRKDDGIGIQKLEFAGNEITNTITTTAWINPDKLCVNDGLSFKDFCDWFKGYDLSKSMAIIHFTKFRYSCKQ
jgi:hypothetical protein